ncbi:MAG: T9SS type A sorting domain-containing protein [Bacteroidetes bacterium]|nr:T9SS type A sorting domain-containing protein [Bacteroidota bacterium]
MISRLLLVAALQLTLVSRIIAQPTITLSKTIGTAGSESIRDLIVDDDDHLIALGICDSIDRDSSCGYHGGGVDIWLVKMDANGTILWQKCYGGSKDDFAYQIIQTDDSGFLFSGWTYSHDGDVTVNDGSFITWLVKLDSTGSIQWQQGLAEGQPYHLMQLKNKKYLIACYTLNTSIDFPVHYGGGFTEDAWIWILTNAGEKDTSFHYGGSDDDVITEVIELQDGDWQMFGYTESDDHDLEGTTAYGNWDGWILRTDSNGVIKFQNRLGDGSPNVIIGAVSLTDSGFLCAGGTNFTDVWVIRLDSATNKIEDYAYGGSGTDAMLDRLRVHSAVSGKYVIGAVTSSNDGDVGINYGFTDFWFLTVDSNAILVNSKVGGGSKDDFPYSNILINSNTVVQAGWTSSNDFDINDYHGAGDGWFIKVGNFTLAGEITDAKKQISVFPNPFHDQFTISSDNGECLKRATIEIYDTKGTLLLTEKIHASVEQISVKGLLQGTYIFVIRDKAKNLIASGKLVVQ